MRAARILALSVLALCLAAIGTPASAEGFKYSDVMKSSGITWDAAALDAYLANPKGYLPGNKMIFVGLKKKAQRADVIAFLKQAQ